MQFGENAAKANAGSCILCCLCYACGCVLIPATIVRGKVQEKVGLPNAGCINNCCVHICCHPCALCQETRALQKVAGAPQEMEMSR
jgi:Cys-rich protein (TIGR01571 family)